MKTTTRTAEGYTATRRDGSRFTLQADGAGRIYATEGRGTPVPIAAGEALALLLEAVGDAELAVAGAGFPALRSAILAGLAPVASFDAPPADAQN